MKVDKGVKSKQPSKLGMHNSNTNLRSISQQIKEEENRKEGHSKIVERNKIEVLMKQNAKLEERYNVELITAHALEILIKELNNDC